MKTVMESEPLPVNPETVFYLAFEGKQRNTAGFKAPADIAELCRREGFQKLNMPYFRNESRTVWQKLWVRAAITASWMRHINRIPSGAIVLYQHPSLGMPVSWAFIRMLKKRKNCRLIALIHDLESLRGGIQGAIREKRTMNRFGDNEFLKEFDVLICHNEHMRKYLIEQGFDPERLVTLELFDYLIPDECPPVSFSSKRENPSIAVAGNLTPGKCGYLYEIFKNGNNPALTVNLYGNGFDPGRAGSGLVWQGSFSPEVLPVHLQGDFGLVWDGPSAKTCAGNTGAYLRYNNPHKTSLYLAAGMPVIVWSQAAIADFVLAHNVGITVDSLYGLETAIQRVSTEQYRQMCENANTLSRKLRDGWFFRNAFRKSLALLN